jgi:hypothetical protein
MGAAQRKVKQALLATAECSQENAEKLLKNHAF